jgi:anaerobic magnesium-protoporphyrin IX monomethyl ester cyclase
MYLAVDAISPAFLRKMCDTIENNGIKLAWSADIRLEKKFLNPEWPKFMRRAGCVALSYGLESASQRILDLIDKGLSINIVPLILRNMKSEGIACQLMCFTGFPTETIEEARQTYDFLTANAENWALAGTGEFTLTPGAIVAKDPGRFGISQQLVPAGDDIAEHILYCETDGTILRSDRWRRKLARNAKSIIRSRYDRPFVGGLDTAHTILYASKYGESWFRNQEIHKGRPTQHPAADFIVRDTVQRTPFSRFDMFYNNQDIEFAKLDGFAPGLALGSSEFDVWLSVCETSGRRDTESYTLKISGDGHTEIEPITWIGNR